MISPEPSRSIDNFMRGLRSTFRQSAPGPRVKHLLVHPQIYMLLSSRNSADAWSGRAWSWRGPEFCAIYHQPRIRGIGRRWRLAYGTWIRRSLGLGANL